MSRAISNPRSVRDHVFSRKADITMLPSQNTPNDHIWQKGPVDLQAEALQKLQLVQLLKQVNPDLHVCPPQKPNNLIGQTKPMVEKGTQVPDTRIPYFGPRKSKAKRVSHVDYVGPGIRIQPRYNRIIHDKCNLTSWRDASRETRQVSINVSNEDLHSAHSLATSMLRADAPPHVPKSVRERSRSIDAIKPPDERVGKNRSHALLKPQVTEAGIAKSVESHNVEKSDNCPPTKDKMMMKHHALSSGDDDSVVVVLNEPKEENDLQRKIGQFFCPRCLRGWSSRNVWCVRGTSRVYIKQTCNTCNKVVNPYMVMKAVQPNKDV